MGMKSEKTTVMGIAVVAGMLLLAAWAPVAGAYHYSCYPYSTVYYSPYLYSYSSPYYYYSPYYGYVYQAPSVYPVSSYGYPRAYFYPYLYDVGTVPARPRGGGAVAAPSAFPPADSLVQPKFSDRWLSAPGWSNRSLNAR